MFSYLIRFKQNGPKFATLSNIVKSNSLSNLKASKSTPTIAALDYPTSFESTFDNLSMNDSRNLESSPISHLNSRYSSRASSPQNILNSPQSNVALETGLDTKFVPNISENSSSNFLSPSPKTLYDPTLYHSPENLPSSSPENKASTQINITPIPSVVQPVKSSFLSTRTPVRMSFSAIPTLVSASLSPTNNSNFTPAKLSQVSSISSIQDTTRNRIYLLILIYLLIQLLMLIITMAILSR